MPASVIVNNMTVVHKKSAGLATNFPDVCKTPTPGGPVPIPYPNIAMSSDTDKGSKKVTMDQESIMLESSNFKMSSGDEAGSAMGVVSNKIKGKAYPKSYSMDVKVEGKAVFRQLDMMLQNGGSPTNTAPMAELQAPLVALMDFGLPELNSVEWNKARRKCGDEVKIKVETSNHPDGVPVGITALRGALPVGLFVEPVRGDKAEIDWITRTGANPKGNVKLDLRAFGVGGMAKSSDPLEIQCPAEKTKTNPKMNRRVPQVVQAPVPGGGTTWVRNPAGGWWGWDYGFDFEIKDGAFIVTCKLKLNAQPGALVTAKRKRQWKRSIESIWSRKWRLHREACQRGDTCNCWGGCCSFPIVFVCEFVSGGEHAAIDVWPGSPDTYRDASGNPHGPLPNGKNAWWTSKTWFIDRCGHEGNGNGVRAHEYGHTIGQYDEYSAGAVQVPHNAATGAITGQPPFASVADSLMGSGLKIKENHLDEYHQWFESEAGETYKRLEL